MAASRSRTRISTVHCLQCGYDLRGNESGVCSECGQPCAERRWLLGVRDEFLLESSKGLLIFALVGVLSVFLLILFAVSFRMKVQIATELVLAIGLVWCVIEGVGVLASLAGVIEERVLIRRLWRQCSAKLVVPAVACVLLFVAVLGVCIVCGADVVFYYLSALVGIGALLAIVVTLIWWGNAWRRSFKRLQLRSEAARRWGIAAAVFCSVLCVALDSIVFGRMVETGVQWLLSGD